MLDDLNELKTFRAILDSGTLSGAGRALGVSLAVVSKRLNALEQRAGVRLIQRTTRSLSATAEGARLAIDVERALEALAAGEARLASGREEPSGTLRISAPVSFGRRHVMPVLAEMATRHPYLHVELSLSDRVSDLVAEGLDVAVRIGEMADSTTMMRKLADNRRILVAAPSYLDRVGRPRVPADTDQMHFLRYGAARSALQLQSVTGELTMIKANSRMRVDSGEAVLDWALAGHGILVKSELDVLEELEDGRFERVLAAWHAGEAPVVALFPTAQHMPPKTRTFIDTMAARIGALSEAGQSRQAEFGAS